MAQEDTQPKQNEAEQKTFTQEEVDDIIKKRLARAKSDVPADYEELKSKAQKFDELEDANKTELQKATEQLQRLQTEIEQRDANDKQRALKEQVSKDTGVPLDLISGETEEEMRDFAERVAKYAKKDPAPVVSGTGKFATANKNDDMSIARQIARQIGQQK